MSQKEYKLYNVDVTIICPKCKTEKFTQFCQEEGDSESHFCKKCWEYIPFKKSDIIKIRDDINKKKMTL